ncbi:MAG: ThuA domain-containing protein [Verrucomicrobia bacterium]|nr:ThuA domain-containing protein [Verrucomicrobiota bacterium]
MPLPLTKPSDAPTALLVLGTVLLAMQAAPAQKAKAPATPPDPTIICFVSHKKSHGFGEHEYAAGCRLIGQALQAKFPEKKVEARYSINWPADPASFFAGADSVVLFCSGGNGHLVNPHVAEFDRLMRQGVGLACLHYAVEVPLGPAAKGMSQWMGGYFEANWSVNPTWEPDFMAFPDHPVARGIKPFKIKDEWYFHLRFNGESKAITPILAAVAPPSTMTRPDGPHSGNPAARKAVAEGRPQPVAWTFERSAEYRKGRGFGFTGIHFHWNFEEDNFRKCLLNGIAWTAGLEIPADGIETTRPTRDQLTALAVQFGGAKPQPQEPAPKAAAAPAPKQPDPHQPSEALSGMQLHPQLEAQLFASEPALLSPSAIDVDHLGRVWVCEVVNYRKHLGKRPEGDRILILQDTDADGKVDQSKVFHQGHDVDSAHGICVLGDRVIISCGDEVFSLYDRDGDGKADAGSKQVLFTRIGGTQHDHGIHAFHFGPDGKLYFNFGNAATQLCDPSGKVVVDLAGREVRAGNLPYQEGMVFRCNLDGSAVETLGWNFRNNWELALDSFGTIWQSDNDDDGNKGVRINFVMEYGNYGYKDEITRAGWRDPRPGMNDEVPLRHWHLDDPGVVPNLLQTGAGSPTGLCFYEGSLLPEALRGQPIHCDAGPNVVRAYPVKPSGAGYRAEMVTLMENSRNPWFRPSDVAVAPDGSLFVADWYDPGVGGHGMADLERGRIFRLAPKGHRHPAVPAYRFDSIEGALEALKSPNESARYLAWQKLASSPEAAIPALHSLFRNAEAPTHLRARALWLLASGIDRNGFPPLMTETLLGADPNLRVTAIRAWRSFFGGARRLADDPELVSGFLTPLIVALDHERDPAVLREMSLAVRFLPGPVADKFWAALAKRYDGRDRWYLEALGIGADLHWDSRLAALPQPHDDIVWRSRAKVSAAKIAELVLRDGARNPGLIRALHFQPDPAATQAAYVRIFKEGSPEVALAAAGLLGRDGVAQIQGGTARLDTLLAPLRGRPELIDLIEKLNLPGFEAEMVEVIFASPESEEAVDATRILLRDANASTRILTEAAREAKPDKAVSLIRIIGKVADNPAVKLLSAQLNRKELSPELRRELVSSLASSLGGGQELVKLAESGKLPADLHFLAATMLARSANETLREAAKTKFKVPAALGTESLPPVTELLAMKGNPDHGKAAFSKGTCITCHKVGSSGVEFGPDLSGIGGKLSAEGLYEAILYPGAAISHGFQGVVVQTKDGSSFAGFITGETGAELTIRLPGGVNQALRKDQIAHREEMTTSLMPPGLAAILSAKELVDLIAWLQSLRG